MLDSSGPLVAEAQRQILGLQFHGLALGHSDSLVVGLIRLGLLPELLAEQKGTECDDDQYNPA